MERTMRKEPFKNVEKAWGEEIWLVNSDRYCAKFLMLNKNAESSYHMHKTKEETFISLKGYVLLTVEVKTYILTPFTQPITIEAGDKHKFLGLSEAVILEVSTHHDEDDVVRFSSSKSGNSNIEEVLQTI